MKPKTSKTIINNSVGVFLLLATVLFVAACGGDNNNNPTDTTQQPISYDGVWWITGHYDGTCGERGPWSAHFSMLHEGHQVQVRSDDIDGGPISETWSLDDNNTVKTQDETVDGTITERRTATTTFESPGALTGIHTYERIEGKKGCMTENHYTGIKLDTLTMDHLKGSHCLQIKARPDAELNLETTQLAMQLRLTEQDGAIVFNTTGGPVHFSGTGTIEDDRLLLTGTGANAMELDMQLAFALSSDHINGTMNAGFDESIIPPMTGSLMGTQAVCWQDLPTTPPTDGILPMDLESIVDFQVYDTIHDGIDFSPNQTLQPVYAPFDGIVTMVNLNSLWRGSLIHTIRINYNEDYYTAINFEPGSAMVTPATEQVDQIQVELMQNVQQGDIIGYLVVPDITEFPHVHWGVGQSSTAATSCPSDYLTETDRIALNTAVQSIEGQNAQSCLLPQ